MTDSSPKGLRRTRLLMPLGEVLFIFQARLKSRTVLIQEGLAVLGIAIGVALLFASQVASQSLDSSVRDLTRQLVGGTQYQIDARGSTAFPEALAKKVQATPGVQAALPLLYQPSTIVGPHGRDSVTLIGVDPQFAKLGGSIARKFSGREIARQRVIALPKPLANAIGIEAFQDAYLQTPTGVHETLVATVLSPSEAGGLIDSQLALAPIKYAQRLAGAQGRISRLYIKLKPGNSTATVAALRHLAVANNLNFVPADFDAVLFSVASAPQQQGESLFSAISAVVGFLFAFNAMLLTVGERRRLIAMMRRHGTSRTMLVQGLMFDALALGVVASIVGLALGELLSVELFHSQPGYLAFAFPVGQQRIVTFASFAEAVGTGFLAALVGVLAPVRDIVARPLRSEEEIVHAPRGWTGARLTVGVLCLIATATIGIAHPASAFVAVVTLVIACMALLPFLFNAAILAFNAAQRLSWSTSTRLAAAELKDPMTRVRSLAVAATGALAVFGGVAISGAQENVEHGLAVAAGEWNHAADIWVSSAGESNSLATTPFSVSTVAKVARLPAVRSVGVYRGEFLNVGNRRVWVIAPPIQSLKPMPAAQLTVGNIALVNEHLHAGGWVVLSEAVAHEQHLRIGESFMLPSPRPTRLRVAGLSTNGGWPPGAIVMNARDYAYAWDSNAVSALNIQVAASYSLTQARAAISAALGPKSGLVVQTATERAAQWTRLSRQGLARLTQISILVSIAAVLAMAGVMISLMYQRRQHVAYLKSTGSRSWLLWRALFFESTVLLGSGCLIGAAFGVAGQLVISHALATVTGFPISISVSFTAAIFRLLAVGGIALTILAIPGYMVVRIRPTMVKPA
jgi:putative ABC transport system permease protein